MMSLFGLKFTFPAFLGLIALVFAQNPVYDEYQAVIVAELAGVAYCNVETAMTLTCSACREINGTYVSLNMTEVPVKQGVHAFVILKSDAREEIVVAFRGTDSPMEIVSQIAHTLATEYTFSSNLPKGAKVQDYFYSVYSALRPAFREVMKEVVKEYPDYSYIYTGHSLGGALATLSATDSLDSGLLPSVPKLYTFGQPRTSNYEFISWTTQHIPDYYRVTHYRDLVTHVPPCVPSVHGGCSRSAGVLPWAPYHGGTEIYYDNFNDFFLDLSGYQSPKGAFQHVVLSIYDHLHYFNFRIGCGNWDWLPFN